VDETLPQQSGIFFENQGPIKIETSKWDLTAYLRVSEYSLNTEVLRQHITNAADYCCSTITNTTNQDCTQLYKATSFTFSQIEEKRELILGSVGHSEKTKRSIPWGAMTKTAKLLFGLCDFHCMRETNKNLDQMKGTKEFKDEEKQFKIVDLTQRKEALILEEHAITLERIRTAAE
jgi:hypothetical protein